MGATGNPANKPLLHHSYLPEFVPNEEQKITVRVMMACGMPVTEIARAVFDPHTNEPISVTTLKKYFSMEMKYGKEQANCAVAKSLFQKALGNSPQAVQACIFWLRSQAGWLAADGEDGKDGKRSDVAKQLVVYLPDNGRKASNSGKADGNGTPTKFRAR
jgi:hypothetical protein